MKLSLNLGFGFNMVPRCLKMAQVAQDKPKLAQKESQDSPQMWQVGPRWAKIAPKLLQQSPKLAQDRFKMSQDGPGLAQDGPRCRWLQDFSNEAPKSFKIAQRCPKRFPRWLPHGCLCFALPLPSASNQHVCTHFCVM